MSTLEMHFRSMARNNLWSNHRLHRACAQLSPEECAEHRGAFFCSILGTLNHILLVDRWYLGHLTGTLSEPMLPHDTMLHADLQSLTRSGAAALGEAEQAYVARTSAREAYERAMEVCQATKAWAAEAAALREPRTP